MAWLSIFYAGFRPRATSPFCFGKRDCSKSSLAAFSLLKALNVLTVRLGLFATCGLARKLFEQSLKVPKTMFCACAERRGTGPPTRIRMAQELALLKQPSPEKLDSGRRPSRARTRVRRDSSNKTEPRINIGVGLVNRNTLSISTNGFCLRCLLSPPRNNACQAGAQQNYRAGFGDRGHLLNFPRCGF